MQHPAILRLTVAALCAATLSACFSMAEPVDERLCAQTYEFGNSGCFEITGQVVSLSGAPLAGIIVGTRYLEGQGLFNSPYSTTGTDGRFGLRAARFASGPNPPSPDTLSLWVHGADPRSAGFNIPATIRASLLVRVTISPVGEMPTATVVQLVMPTP